MYLVRFEYEYYCQGYEMTTETILVKNASSYNQACELIKQRYSKAHRFENLTIE